MTTSASDIKNLTIPWLFQDLREGKKTGTATFSRDTEIKKVFIRSGEIIYASSNLASDQLSASLLRSGKITEAQHTIATDTAQRTGKSFGSILIERGLITSKDLVDGAKLQARQIVLSLFLWQDGRYTFENGVLPFMEIVPLQLETGSLIFEGIRSVDWKIVRKSLPSLKTVLKPVKDVNPLMQGIELDQDHQTIISFINGTRSIEELCALSEIGDFSTLRVVYGVIALRLVEQAGIKTAEEISQGVQTILGGNGQDDADTTSGVTVTRDMILQALNSLADQDYYEMLDVGRNATQQEIRKAYFLLAKRYHPDRHIDTELSDMKEDLETLFVNITEAYNTLSVESKRDKYLLDLAKGIKKYHIREQATTHKHESQKGNAVSQFNEGMKQYRIQNFWGAEEAFRWAVRLDPSNPDYVFHQGLALAHMPRRRHEADEFFQRAIKMAPARIEYYLELGNFYVKNGLKKRALTVFNDALQRDPNSEKIKQAIKNVGG